MASRREATATATGSAVGISCEAVEINYPNQVDGSEQSIGFFSPSTQVTDSISVSLFQGGPQTHTHTHKITHPRLSLSFGHAH